MLKNSEFLVLITRYLNDPENTDNRIIVEQFRSKSLAHEKYFLEVERIWKLSPLASTLNSIDEKQSIKKIKLALNQNPSSNHLLWWKCIAASIFIVVCGYWIYNEATKINFLVKRTAQHQVDSVKLADGSVIILAENSELKYPNKFGSIRAISLVKGQAFFKIAKDPKHPFKVAVNQSNVVVLGTSFNIKMSSKKIDLGVVTGKVAFTPYPNGMISTLNPGEGISYHIQSKALLSTKAQNSNSWLTKELLFVDTPLEEVCKQLSEYYGKEIVLQNSNHNGKKLNAIFKKQSLNQVLEILNKTYHIKINIINNQINLITP